MSKTFKSFLSNAQDLIYHQRKKLGLSQDKLGELANVSRVSIIKIENGQAVPTLQSLIAIFEVLDLKLVIGVSKE